MGCHLSAGALNRFSSGFKKRRAKCLVQRHLMRRNADLCTGLKKDLGLCSPWRAGVYFPACLPLSPYSRESITSVEPSSASASFNCPMRAPLMDFSRLLPMSFAGRAGSLEPFVASSPSRFSPPLHFGRFRREPPSASSPSATRTYVTSDNINPLQ